MALIYLYCKPATFSTIWVRGINLRQNRFDVYSCDIFLDVIVYCSSSGHVFSTTCCHFQYISSCYTLRSIVPHYPDHIYQHSLSDMSQHFVFNLTPCSNCVFDKSYRKYIKELFFWHLGGVSSSVMSHWLCEKNYNKSYNIFKL